ncbi:MAG: HAMP domain-containing protein [Candidatus Abyssobacteria bacterium SURF_5]|uniref:histidine kinase n=1 Tax=Abyssobacteria bacterium (strain SURF_5) TaxID=2093360 RepID=A0A3A4NB17_ABYX5|nr:MAG: HAMP domain-containing protein [Candidatus Abyssubacteria bacterium SURF_5]
MKLWSDVNRLMHRYFARWNKLQNKIFLPFLAVMIFIAVFIIYGMMDLVSSNVEARVNEKLDNDVRLVQEMVSDMEKSLAFYAEFIADTEKLAGHISEARDSRLILIYLLEFLNENGIYSDIGGSGTRFAKRNPELSRLGMLGIRTIGLVSEFEDGKPGLAISAVARIEGRSDSRSVVTVSKRIDSEFLQDLCQKAGAYRLQVYHRGILVESSSRDERCDALVRQEVTPKLMSQVIVSGVPYISEYNYDGHSVKMSLAPLVVNFKKDAIVAVFESIDDLSRTKRNIVITTIVAVGLMLLIVVPIYVLTVSKTIDPIRELSRASNAVAEGNLDQYVPVRTSDEVGELSKSFNLMVADLRKYREELERWNQTLEERVAKRSEQLAEAQAKLIQSSKLAAVGELAAGIAHELNNPLAGIYAFLQVLAETVRARGFRNVSDEEAEGFQKNLVYVEREIQRCKSIVGSLLTFARVSEKHFVPLSLNDVVRETLGFMQSNLKKDRVKVETRLTENLPPVLGDPNELQQVFLNIIVNARKAMPDGGTLFVSSGADERTIQVSITDTGEGIKPEIRDRIFDPFFTTRKPGEGTGLGLSISYGIIKDHNGEILAESTPGRGSTFTVVLPIMSEERASVSSGISAGEENPGNRADN